MVAPCRLNQDMCIIVTWCPLAAIGCDPRYIMIVVAGSTSNANVKPGKCGNVADEHVVLSSTASYADFGIPMHHQPMP